MSAMAKLETIPVEIDSFVNGNRVLHLGFGFRWLKLVEKGWWIDWKLAGVRKLINHCRHPKKSLVPMH